MHHPPKREREREKGKVRKGRVTHKYYCNKLCTDLCEVNSENVLKEMKKI